MCSKEDDTDLPSPPSPPPPPPAENLSFTTLSIHSNKSITEVFQTNAIVNQEMNCFVNGTAITVSSIDPYNHTITLNWVPAIPSITSPTTGKEWIVGIGIGTEPSVGGQNQAYLKITGGNYSTKTLTYQPNVLRHLDSFIVGARVYLFNIYGNGWNFNMGHSSVLIPMTPSTYYSSMLGPGGVWKHSDGNYRMAVNGFNGTNWQVGLFSSTDLINWTSLSSIPKLTYQAGTWRNNGLHVSDVHKLDNSNRYIGYGYGQDGPFMRIGWVTFDENMDHPIYSPTEIISTNGTHSGLYEPSVSHSDGEYKMLVAARTAANLEVEGWEMWEAYSPTADGIFTFRKKILNTTDTSIRDTYTCYRNSHTTETKQFYWNDQLCSIVDGTGRWNYSANRGERQFGIMYNNSGTWTDYLTGITMGSYEFASTIWDRPNGHVGGSPVIFYDKNKLYMYFAMTQSTNAYQVVGSVYDLLQ